LKKKIDDTKESEEEDSGSSGSEEGKTNKKKYRLPFFRGLHKYKKAK